MASTQVVQPETLKSIAEVNISATYAAVGTPFSNPIRIMVLVNNTDGDMFISLDGINDQMFMPKSTSRVYDFNTNRLNVDQQFVVQKGTQVYVRYSSAPTTGSFYAEGIWGVSGYAPNVD